ncbi:uncharacterized protein F5891DRAFT_536070 [Suillus fuscotomentosus]|uniref:C2H2-type domain-containing protein n=1 Tax=Suillus fuscotomentosus TaxID=1912939 RepID=A0AAD4E0A0_9AGAM|nr:uncharacterized protein F5891DRAFT_536070 [Suillus fuscotomentosus]KAG1897383.1 hypothetical protein F5891DRAFT_536070 [Suillus fuscotomentosus]
MNLLDNYQPDATMEDSDGCYSTIDSQAGLDSLNAILPPESSHDPCFVLQHALHKASFGVVQSLSEGTEGELLYMQYFFERLPCTGLLPHGARSCADYVTRTQHSMYSAGTPAFPDPGVMESSSDGVDARFDLPLHGASNSIHELAAKPFQGIYLEENAPSSFAARPDVELLVPVGQVSQAKVKCTWERCSALVNKDNLTRHVKEVHEGKIKAVCACCGKEFKRPYQMNEHKLRTGCGMS